MQVLPYIHFHDLKHDHTSLMIFQNDPMKLIEDNLDIARLPQRWIHMNTWQKDASNRFDQTILADYIQGCQMDTTRKKTPHL